MRPKVSIIMGVLNGEKTVSDCIDSILSQTYQEWELIICDDGSTDRTCDIIGKYVDSYPEKIHLLKNSKNLKLAATLNKCINYSSGEYIARMDADDKCFPCRLEKQIQFLENNKGYSVVGASAVPFDESITKGIRVCPEIPNTKDLLWGPPHIHPSVIFRKNAINSLGGYNTSKEVYRCEDLDLWYRFYSAGYRGYNIQEPLLFYREGYEDYRRRTIKSGINMSRTMLQGYKKNKVPFIYYPIILKPIISAILPSNFMMKYHLLLDKRNLGKTGF